jgi:hypothetical protein
MIVTSKVSQDDYERFWIAYGPSVIEGEAPAGSRLETGQEFLEVFDNPRARAERALEIKADLRAALEEARAKPTEPFGMLAYHRWQREVGGFRLPGGIAVGTDEGTQNKLGNFTAQAVVGAAPEVVEWKTDTGFLHLTKTQVIEIAAAVTAHITLCFAIEKEISEAMQAMDDLSAFDPVAAFDAAYDTQARALGIIE